MLKRDKQNKINKTRVSKDSLSINNKSAFGIPTYLLCAYTVSDPLLHF